MASDSFREIPWYQRLVARLFHREETPPPAPTSRYTEYVHRKAAEAPSSKEEMRQSLSAFRAELEHQAQPTLPNPPTPSA